MNVGRSWQGISDRLTKIGSISELHPKFVKESDIRDGCSAIGLRLGAIPARHRPDGLGFGWRRVLLGV